MTWAILLGGLLVVVIDRIESDYAVLEWREGVHTPMPLVVLPSDVIEGDRLQVQWKRMPRIPPPSLPSSSKLPDFSEIPQRAESPPTPPVRTSAPKEPPC